MANNFMSLWQRLRYLVTGTSNDSDGVWSGSRTDFPYAPATYKPPLILLTRDNEVFVFANFPSMLIELESIDILEGEYPFVVDAAGHVFTLSAESYYGPESAHEVADPDLTAVHHALRVALRRYVPAGDTLDAADDSMLFRLAVKYGEK